MADAPAPTTTLTEDEQWEVIHALGTPPSRSERAAATARAMLRAAVRQLPKQVARSAIIAGVAFVIGWIANVWVLAYGYDGFRAPSGAPVTGQGSRVSGSVFWFVLSAAVTAAVAYRLRVGKGKFRDDVRQFPKRLRGLVMSDRDNAAVHGLWGFGGALVVTAVVGTSVALLLGATFVAALATVLRPVVVGVVGFAWRMAMAKVAPTKKRPPRPGAMAVAGIAAMAAAVVASQITDAVVTVALGIAAGVGAFALSRRQTAPRLAMIVSLASAVVYVLFDTDLAAADDGGAIECVDWPRNCPGVATVYGEGLTGATAAAAGALVGDAVGSTTGEEDDDEDEDDCGGGCMTEGSATDDESYEIEWEWVKEDPDPIAGADAWKKNNPGRSIKEYNEEAAWKRVEESRKKALAKIASLDKLSAETQVLLNQLDKMEADVNAALSSKPWASLTNAERHATKKQLISTMKARGLDNAAIQHTVGILDQESGLSSADMMTYVLGEIVMRTPGEALKAGGQTLSAISKEIKGAPELIKNMAAAYAEDVASGNQAARLANPFKTAYEYYGDKNWQQVQADFNEIAQVTGNASAKLTEAGAKQFVAAMDGLHKAQMTGDAVSIAQPVAKFLGSELSEELLSLGMGKAMKLGKAGLGALSTQVDIAKTHRALSRAEAAGEKIPPRPAGGVPGGGTKPPGGGPSKPAGGGRPNKPDGGSAGPGDVPGKGKGGDVPGKGASDEVDDYVKAPNGTAIDTDEKLHHFGALPDEAKALQKVVNEEGVIIEMRPGGRDRANHLATGQVGQKGQYNHNNTVKAEDMELGVGFRQDDIGLAGGLTDDMYAKLSDKEYLKSLSPAGQARASERMEEFVDRADERAKLAKGKFERVPDEFSESGRKTVVQQRVRDKNGVDRHPQTGRPDTGDWDIGDIRLPDRQFFHDKHGNPLKDHKLLRADQEKYNQVVKRLMAEVNAGGSGSIRHPGGYWKPRIKVTKNKKTGLPEINCGDVKTNRRINQKNKLGDPNSTANLQFAPGASSPSASYNPTGKPRYDQPLPGEAGYVPPPGADSVPSVPDVAAPSTAAPAKSTTTPTKSTTTPPPKAGGGTKK